jgi:uroporphyrinogen-III synthase
VDTLCGRHIVVTRPEAQAGHLCEAIAARGGVPVLFPLLAIAPASDPAELESIVGRLEGFDLAFFVSPNAVQHAMRFILARRRWPGSVQVATVGKGSERTLAEFGFDAVIAPESGFDSEAVIALPQFAPDQISGRRVVIFRGDGGRDLLATTLRARGAEVEYVTCYRRYCPELDAGPMIELARAGQLDAITLTSSEGVPNLVQLLGNNGLAAVREVPVLVPHSRIAAAAREAGFVRVIETGAGDAGLLQSLDALFAR